MTLCIICSVLILDGFRFHLILKAEIVLNYKILHRDSPNIHAYLSAVALWALCSRLFDWLVELSYRGTITYSREEQHLWPDFLFQLRAMEKKKMDQPPNKLSKGQKSFVLN